MFIFHLNSFAKLFSPILIPILLPSTHSEPQNPLSWKTFSWLREGRCWPMPWDYEWDKQLVCITQAFKKPTRRVFIPGYPPLQTWLLCVSTALHPRTKSVRCWLLNSGVQTPVQAEMVCGAKRRFQLCKETEQQSLTPLLKGYGNFLNVFSRAFIFIQIASSIAKEKERCRSRPNYKWAL